MKVDRGPVVFPIAEAAGHFFHHLNLAIQAFGSSVGEAMAKIGQDVRQKLRRLPEVTQVCSLKVTHTANTI